MKVKSLVMPDFHHHRRSLAPFILLNLILVDGHANPQLIWNDHITISELDGIIYDVAFQQHDHVGGTDRPPGKERI